MGGNLSAMGGKLMKAVQYRGPGGGAAALEHVEVPIPSPGKFEVLVKVEATSLNSLDWQIQKGDQSVISPRKYPHIPSCDVAGEVVLVGPGVKDFKSGDKVVAYLGNFSGGGLAEYAVANENLTAARPPEVSSADGASILLAALTAHEALTRAGIKFDGSGPQKNVLVIAASGGVGHYAVQLAKLGNAHVTATCGARNIELVKGLGADEVLDYKTPEGASLKSPSGKTYEVVINAPDTPFSTIKPNLSGEAMVIELVPKFIEFLSYPYKMFAKQKAMLVYAKPTREKLEFLLDLAKEGKLKTVIDSKYPLSKAEDGWARSMTGRATGKIIVEP